MEVYTYTLKMEAKYEGVHIHFKIEAKYGGYLLRCTHIP